MNRATFFKTLIGLPTVLVGTKALPAKKPYISSDWNIVEPEQGYVSYEEFMEMDGMDQVKWANKNEELAQQYLRTCIDEENKKIVKLVEERYKQAEYVRHNTKYMEKCYERSMS